MKFIKDNFLTLIILVLVVLIFSNRCGKPPVPEKPKIERDTVWMHHDSVIITKPQIINTLPSKIDTIYLPDPDYNKLKEQYMTLLTLYLNKNVQRDSLKIDSIGYVFLTDTVTKNFIDSRKYNYSLKYPIITTTITLPPPLKNQVYIGGALQGTPSFPINQITAGLLLKNKKDQIFGAYTGFNKDGNMVLGAQIYWKIKIR